MTKFAQELSDAARPDWREHYIGYERLKQLIKGLHRDIEQQRRAAAAPIARPPTELLLSAGTQDFASALDGELEQCVLCLLYTSPSPRDRTRSRMPSSA